MATIAPYHAASKRGLILHDTLAFLALLAIAVALFGVTLFLHRSFESHRVDLAVRWAERGRLALQNHHPEQAVGALRTSLSYEPDNRDNQLLLAQALEQAGHIDEANNYFLNLWDARPGDGFINYELARLARMKGENTDAENYYHAAIFGDWRGDATSRRRQCRLELADFLIQQNQRAEARNELFIVAGNAPADEAVPVAEIVAQKLAEAGFLQDALTVYQKAVSADPHGRRPLELAGKAAYQLGDYATAEKLLQRAREQKPESGESPAKQAEIDKLAEDAHRIQQLTLSRDQPARERADHILAASQIAQNRLNACATHVGSSPADAMTMSNLNASWAAASSGTKVSRRALLENASAQDNWTQLIYLTEQDTAQVCGQPTGDDALLLRLANAANPGGKEVASNGK